MPFPGGGARAAQLRKNGFGLRVPGEAGIYATATGSQLKGRYWESHDIPDVLRLPAEHITGASPGFLWQIPFMFV